jgi:hypothetical protein
MSRVRDLASILTASSSMATDAEVSAVSAQIPANVSGKNFVINGGFDVYQRGSFSSSSPGYSLDRWYMFGSLGSAVSTQQSSGAPVGSHNHLRLAYTATGVWNIWQFIESSNVKALQGRTVTLTAKIRRNATFSSNYIMGVYKSPTANAGPSASWSQVGSTAAINANIPTGTTSSDWLTLTTTVVIPSDGTAEGLAVVFFENTANLNGSYIEISQVQLEVGSVATTFSRAGGDIQGELAKCQRYYFRMGGDSVYQRYGTGYAFSTTRQYVVVNLPVTMRIPPNSLDYLNLSLNIGGAGGDYLASSATIDQSSKHTVALNVFISAVASANMPNQLGSQNTLNSYLGFSAEL